MALAGLELKHFVADFLLQSDVMIQQKGSWRQVGGYFHAALHGLGTALVFSLLPLAFTAVILLVLIDFVVHYALDYFKDRVSGHIKSSDSPRAYWAHFGFDQMLHHLTYLGLAFLAVNLI